MPAGCSQTGMDRWHYVTYNYRIMHTERMKKAVNDSFKAGIGLTAMKTQATGWATGQGPLSDKERALLNQFKKKGLSAEQAKLKAVWDDNRIASICSYMTNMKVLSDNASAATDNKKLSVHDIDYLKQYARETASNYCTGCANVCEPIMNNQVPISDVMRYLMYSRCYGDHERAKMAFIKLPSEVRRRMGDINYDDAERKCPNKLPIGQLMREVVIELA